jgi:hypothetical protein
MRGGCYGGLSGAGKVRLTGGRLMSLTRVSQPTLHANERGLVGFPKLLRLRQTPAVLLQMHPSIASIY